jgi:tetratricopeptide (TPR) repeat protein
MLRSSKFRRAVGAIALIVATMVAYLPAIRGGFIWDDPDYVVNNDNLRSVEGLARIWFVPKSSPQYYPLVHTTFWIEYHLWGLNPAGFHVVNVLLHIAASLLLWRLLTLLHIPGAWLAAAVWALHPMNVESVAWITERKNVLSGVFYFAAAIAYFRFVETDQRRWKLYWIALGLFICALLSKTVTATLPAAILVVIWWKRGRIAWRDVAPLIPFFVIGAGLGLYTAYLEKHFVGATGERIAELNLSVPQRILIAGRVIWFYAWTIIWPQPLVFIYPRWDVDPRIWWQWLFPLAVVVVLLTLWLNRARFGRGPLAAALIYCGTLFPVLGFLNVYPMRFSFVADHFAYLASVGLIVVVSALLRAKLGSVLLIPVAILTFTRCFAYADAETLWRDTLAKNDQSWMVYTNLGNALVAKEQLDEAERLYDSAFQLAPRLHDTLTNVGMMHGYRGRYDAAVLAFLEALQINPGFAPAHYGLGQVYARMERPDDAERELRAAIASAPQYPEANYRLGIILEGRGDIDAAIKHYRTAVTYKPDFPEARFNLGNALIRKRALNEAMHNLMEAVRVKPDYAEAWTSLGGAQLAAGHREEAAASFRRALHLNPNIIPAQRGLEAALPQTGR